jgi:phosphohistidine swiveling domain-containing protein
MTKGSKKLSVDGFIRMFEFNRIPAVIAEIFVRGYEGLEVCVFFNDPWWSSHISLESSKAATAEGFELYKTKESIQSFKERFYEYRSRAEKRFEEIAAGEAVCLEDFRDFTDLWRELYYFYRRTEFFYVDAVFSSIEDKAEQKELIEDFGRFKYEARTFLNEAWFAGRTWYFRTVALISKITGIPIEDIGYLTIDEIGNALQGNPIDISNIEKRKTAYFFSNVGDTFEFWYGDEAKEKIKQFLGDTKEIKLKGTVANKGYATGPVKILMADMNRPETIAHVIATVKAGDIILAETTSPEWMPACKKAGAIVTAQGGLLSHAAIVSRELGIPCIVGVADILRKVKNGDILEVDANANTIKIVKNDE